jgi:hypothetical protein
MGQLKKNVHDVYRNNYPPISSAQITSKEKYPSHYFSVTINKLRLYE